MAAQIPFRIDIEPFESGRGYLLRLADRLEYSGPLLIKDLSGISYSGPSHSSALCKLAEFLRQDSAVLSDHFYIGADQSVSSLQIPFLGHMVHRDYVNHGSSKMCPICLVNGRPAQAIWDLGLVTACPDHNCQLVESCFHCSKPLSWLRPRLYRCSCGADLRKTKAVKAEVAEIAIGLLIHRVAGGPEESHFVDYGYCPAIIESSLQNLLHVIEFVGAKFHRFLNDFSASYRRRGDPRETREVITMAHEILSNWPVNFHNRLSQIFHKTKAPGDNNGVYARAFHAFYRYRFPKGAGLDFIKAEFTKFSDTSGNRPLRLIGRRREEEQEQQVWLTPPQAAAMVGDISPAVFHHFASRGILNCKVEDDGKRRRGVWIERDSIIGWLNDAPKWISSRDAEALLGLSRSLMLKVSNVGLMETRRGGVPGLMDTRNFRKADVQKIVTAFRRTDVPVLNLSENPDWVVLRKFGRGAKSNKNALEQIIAAVCGGRLDPIGKLGPNAKVLDYVFHRSALNEMIQVQNGYSRIDLMNRFEVENFLTASQAVVDALVREELLSPLARNGKRVECLFLKREVSDFADMYVLASHLAREKRTHSAWIKKYLSRLGVEGKTIKYHHATTVLYRRNEIQQHIGLLNKFAA